MTDLSDLRVVWPTRSRTGSQFLVQLTMAVKSGLMPQSRISGNRAEGFKPGEKQGDPGKMIVEGRGLDYLAQNRIRALKYEDPGKDDFVQQLANAAPHAVFVASHRPIEKVLESHFNIKWGHSEADVLHQFSSCLALYERLASQGRMFLVDVTNKSTFDVDRFARFLGVETVPTRARTLVEEWQPINDLKYQVEKTGAYTGRVTPPRLDRLRHIHDWIENYESRYRELVAWSSPLAQRVP